MVDKVPNATVLNNGQEIGTTSSSGTLVVPTLTSYGQNRISLDVKNIPMDYSISGVNEAISPSIWSGSCVAFNAVKTRAITGTIFVEHDTKKVPVEFQEGTLTIGARSITFPTGKGGEFYIEDVLPKELQEGRDRQSCSAIAERRATGGKAIKPGTYPASIDYDRGRCEFFITFPETEDVITDIGEVQCVPVRKSE
jgi:outer membrane usher protein FimD/PapC